MIFLYNNFFWLQAVLKEVVVDKSHVFFEVDCKIALNLKLVRNLQRILFCCRSGIRKEERKRKKESEVSRCANYELYTRRKVATEQKSLV